MISHGDLFCLRQVWKEQFCDEKKCQDVISEQNPGIVRGFVFMNILKGNGSAFFFALLLLHQLTR
jgi:hypothetical protein